MPCPAATKLMRKSTSGQDVIIVGTSSTILVPHSETRVSLVIWIGAIVPAFLSWGKDAVAGRGLRLDEWNSFVKLTIGEDGAIVRGPIYAISSAVNTPMGYWDAHLPPVIEG